MIYCLTGELIILDALSYTAVIDCAGVGYKVTVTANTLTKLSSTDRASVRVFTHMQVREDAVELYGFYDTKELEMFKLLITVSGVGPKAACAILSVLSPNALALAISTEDSKAIARAQGVGAKTAARVVLELKDKFKKEFPVSDTAATQVVSGRGAPAASASVLSDAKDALLVLGYTSAEAMKALKNADPNADVETVIRQALAYLMS